MKNELLIENTKPILGLPVNYVWRGYGSALFIEFGKLSKDKGGNHPQGVFSLMLDCDWRIEKPKSILIGSDFSKRRIDNQVKKLIGCTVKKIETFGYLPEITISLLPNFRVVSFTTYHNQPDWGLFLPDRSCLCCKRGSIVRE